MSRTHFYLHHTYDYYHPLMTPTTSSYSQKFQEIWGCMLVALAIWFCVSASVRYGYYGDSRLVLGPSSSRLVKASSVFVQNVEVRNEHDNNNVMLYGFNQKPELSSQTNWTTSKFLVVPAFTRKGFSLWLNKGSIIHIRLEAKGSSMNQLEGVVIKGEKRYEKLKPKQTISSDEVTIGEIVNGKEAEFMIEEDDMYQIGVINMNDKNIILNMNVNVSAKVYDTSKANNNCSTLNGSCRLSLLFPNTYYVILNSPKNGDDADDDGWVVQVSFMARVVPYIALLGGFIIVIFLILKCLGVCDGDDDHNNSNNMTVDITYRTSNNVVVSQEITEPESMSMQVKKKSKRNRTGEDDDDDDDDESDASSSSSGELYDEKLCIICYDEQRNCFFVPCGHCATCYDCAKRIVDGESKVCPVCRRLIHKVRRLFNS